MTDNTNKITDNNDNILNISCVIIKSLFESIENYLNGINLKIIIGYVLKFILLIFFIINGINYIIGTIFYCFGILFLILSSFFTDYLNFDKQIKNQTLSDVIENLIIKIQIYINPFVNFCKDKYNQSTQLATKLNQQQPLNILHTQLILVQQFQQLALA
jgi:hypothetical protein